MLPEHKEVVSNLIQNWKEDAPKYLGKEEYYPDFLAFFKREMDTRHGGRRYEEVVNEYLFAGTPEADDLLVRLYSGFLHPLIQLMYGLEWKQPAIVAEGLAQAAVHGDDIGPSYLLPAEEAAKSRKQGEMGKILDLLERGVRQNEKLAKAAQMKDGNKIRDGILKRAREEAVELASKVNLKRTEEELKERTREMYDAAVFMASAAALVKREKKKKGPRFDFFLMHHVTSAPFFTTVNSQDWISLGTKVRLLEWKIRMDLVQYAARGAPELSLDAIASYQPKPKEKAAGSPEGELTINFSVSFGVVGIVIDVRNRNHLQQPSLLRGRRPCYQAGQGCTNLSTLLPDKRRRVLEQDLSLDRRLGTGAGAELGKELWV